MRIFVVALLISSLAFPAAPQRRARRPSRAPITLAIRNVTVIDATGAAPLQHMTVLVSRDKIAAIQPAKVRVAKSIPSIDGTGKFLIPGLWDMHVHLFDKRSMFPLYVANGVTGVRDMGSDFDRTNRWRDEAMAGKRAGPMVFTSGTPVDGPSSEPAKFSVIRIASPHDARRAVDRLEDTETDFIKVLSTISRDSYMALAHRARLLRAPFAGHLPESVSVLDAINNRQRSMEHLFGLMLACSSEETELRQARAEAIRKSDTAELRRIRERTYQTFSEFKSKQIFELLRNFHVYQTPTLTLRARLSYIDVEKHVSDPLLKYVPEDVKGTWQDPRERLRDVSPEMLANLKTDFDEHAKLTVRLARAGVPLLAGTDTGDPYVLPGFSLHDELEMLVRAGLHPMQALQTATVNAARYFGEDALVGTIGKGKQADLVLLNGNPLADITNTRKIHAVVLRGKLYTGKRLTELLESAKKLE